MPKEAFAYLKSLARKHSTHLSWERNAETEIVDLINKNAVAVNELVRLV